ncbi:hypothetical protein [Streptomyces sp. NPDC046942]|uniref:hypothetical protein n=1 Tax=Streptomyces sp. NPDC046942 TaxID=3155137 RepID=UPI00340754B7
MAAERLGSRHTVARGRSWAPLVERHHVLLQAGGTSRLIYRPRRHRKHKGKRRDTFAWSAYRDLVVRALDTHRAAGMRDYAAAHDGLTVIQLPS